MIIDCKYENGKWIFMRQVDRLVSNSLEVTTKESQSILTEEKFLKFIDTESTFIDEDDDDDTEFIAPPNKRQRTDDNIASQSCILR